MRSSQPFGRVAASMSNSLAPACDADAAGLLPLDRFIAAMSSTTPPSSGTHWP